MREVAVLNTAEDREFSHDMSDFGQEDTSVLSPDGRILYAAGSGIIKDGEETPGGVFSSHQRKIGGKSRWQ